MNYIGEIQYDNDLLHYQGNIIIFGAGLWGEKAYSYLTENNQEAQVVCFSDNNQSLWNTMKFGLPLIPPVEVPGRFPNTEYVVASKYAREISKQLMNMQIPSDRIHLLRF